MIIKIIAGIHNRVFLNNNFNIYQDILGLSFNKGFSKKLYTKVEIKNNNNIYIGLIT